MDVLECHRTSSAGDVTRGERSAVGTVPSSSSSLSSPSYVGRLRPSPSPSPSPSPTRRDLSCHLGAPSGHPRLRPAPELQRHKQKQRRRERRERTQPASPRTHAGRRYHPQHHPQSEPQLTLQGMACRPRDPAGSHAMGPFWRHGRQGW